MINLFSHADENCFAREGIYHFNFIKWDNGAVFNLVPINHGHPYKTVPGTIIINSDEKPIKVHSFGLSEDQVRIIISWPANTQDRCDKSIFSTSTITGYVKVKSLWKKVAVNIISHKDEIFSRNKGVLETDALRNERVLFIGVGSLGSVIALDVTKSGVFNLGVIDDERYEAGNNPRHAASFINTGRFKTRIMADDIYKRNPDALVKTWELTIDWDYMDWEGYQEIGDIIEEYDLVICTTDNRPSRLIVNRLCIERNKTCIFAGAYRRGYGGMAQKVVPYVTPCYQCYAMGLKDDEDERELSNRNREVVYSDRPVPIEPGLSIDLRPISTMTSKIAIQELLKDKETTLRSLDADLNAPIFMWLNRREPGTDFESWTPLSTNISGMHILRWYGVEMERQPNCPVCGDFEAQFEKPHACISDKIPY